VVGRDDFSALGTAGAGVDIGVGTTVVEEGVRMDDNVGVGLLLAGALIAEDGLFTDSVEGEVKTVSLGGIIETPSRLTGRDADVMSEDG
jgi:hypothetical protein